MNLFFRFVWNIWNKYLPLHPVRDRILYLFTARKVFSSDRDASSEVKILERGA